MKDRGQRQVLFLRLKYALELLEAAQTPRERLVIRYMLFNGLSPMEVSDAKIENLDPVDRTLLLSRRHWKRNVITDIDPETVRLQIIYSGDRTRGPLIRSWKDRHLTRTRIWQTVKIIAERTSIPGKEKISPLTLKRTFAREWLLSGGTVGSLQKQLGHKHLWSTAHYLRFLMEDVKHNHARMMRRWEIERRKESLRTHI